MSHFSSFFVFFALLVVLVDSRSVPFKIPNSQPTQSSQTLILVDVPPTRQHNVEGNVIHSEENGSPVLFENEGYGNNQLSDNKVPKQVSKVEGLPVKESNLGARSNAKKADLDFSNDSSPLLKFYLNRERPISPSDSIVFPTPQAHFETKIMENQEQDQNIIPRTGDRSSFNPISYRNSDLTMPSDYPAEQEIKPQPPTEILPLLSPEQEQLTYELLAHLLQSLLRRSAMSHANAQVSTNPEVGTSTSKPIDIIDSVDFQSLYSGPRFQKSPCPEGQHRTHNGLCQEASRKLANSRG